MIERNLGRKTHLNTLKKKVRRKERNVAMPPLRQWSKLAIIKKTAKNPNKYSSQIADFWKSKNQRRNIETFEITWKQMNIKIQQKLKDTEKQCLEGNLLL